MMEMRTGSVHARSGRSSFLLSAMGRWLPLATAPYTLKDERTEDDEQEEDPDRHLGEVPAER